MKKLRCRKCLAEKGAAHRSTCEVTRHPWAFSDATVYTMTDASPSSSSSSWSGSYDCGTSSDSGSGGGCE